MLPFQQSVITVVISILESKNYNDRNEEKNIAEKLRKKQRQIINKYIKKERKKERRLSKLGPNQSILLVSIFLLSEKSDHIFQEMWRN